MTARATSRAAYAELETSRMTQQSSCWHCRNSKFNSTALELRCKKDLPRPEVASDCPGFIDSRKESVIALQNAERARKR